MDAAILSWMRSPVTSRSNWANDQQHIQRQSSHRGGGVELRGDRHERGPLSIERLDDAGEVRQGARQPVDLVDNDPPANIGQQSLQRGTSLMTGHEGEGTSQTVYKHDTPLRVLRVAIAKVQWPELQGRFA